MSFKTRMEQLDTNILTLENAEPFVLNQVFPPNQKDWEDAWVAAGNVLPIPTLQELYWYDGINLRGEFKTLPDQFSMLSKSQSEGFQIRDIAGWEDDEHLIVFVVRDDPDAPQGACRMYMDGTLEELDLGGSFTPTGLLGYDTINELLWYVDSSFRIRYINVNTLAIVTVATAASSANLPEWRFFVLLGNGSGDVYYGARLGADPARRLYFYDISALSNTMVLATFNPGTGSVAADRPVAATAGYVFLSTLDTRAAFDGNTIHQINRTGHTWQVQVDAGTYSDEVRTLVYEIDYTNNLIYLVVSHLLPSVLFQDCNQVVQWNAALQTSEFDSGQPHLNLLRNLQTELNDHGLDYHVSTRLYYNPSFIADGGDEEHYNNIGALLPNPSQTKYLIHDLGWHTWTVDDAPDIWVYGDTSGKIYRVSDWQDVNADVIIVETGILNTGISDPIIVSLADVPPDYGLIEVVFEIYGSVAQSLYPALYDPAGGYGESIGSTNPSALAADEMNSTSFFLSELSTNASLIHQYLFRYLLATTQEITFTIRHSVRTAFGAETHRFQEGFGLTAVGALEVPDFELAINSGTVTGNRYVVRAWRTQPRMKHEGSEYDPSMA